LLARVRLSVPDRPGSLGTVTSAIGAAGADIVKIDVLESESGRALDDVFVTVRDAAHLAAVVSRLEAVVGVKVSGTQQPAPPVTGHADLELIDHVLSAPQRALQILVDGGPHAFGADWAAIVEYAAGEFSGVVAVSTQAPEPGRIKLTSPLRLASVRVLGADTQPYGGAALVPLGSGPLALLLVRTDGPEFHRSELWRVGQVGQIVGTVLTPV
jgi:hypothetical protein